MPILCQAFACTFKDYILHPEYQYCSHFCTLPCGERLHYLDEGEGPVVVLLHGNPTWSFYYRNLIYLLRKEYRVIAPDHLGCGLSDKPAGYNYSLGNHISNLRYLFDSLEIKKASFVLHDWGGAIGFGLIAGDPQIAEKIVVHNTAAFRSLRIPLRIGICKTPLLGRVLIQGANLFARAATFMAVSRPMRRDIKQAYLSPYNSWENRRAVYAFVRDIPLHRFHSSYGELVQAEKGVEMMQKADVPLLVLWGGKDFCFTKHFYAEWLRRFPDCRRHFFSDYGHYLLEDAGMEAFSRIRDFLS